MKLQFDELSPEFKAAFNIKNEGEVKPDNRFGGLKLQLDEITPEFLAEITPEQMVPFNINKGEISLDLLEVSSNGRLKMFEHIPQEKLDEVYDILVAHNKVAEPLFLERLAKRKAEKQALLDNLGKP